MSNNDEKKLGKSEHFELREKRLKLVYRILYVTVDISVNLPSIDTNQSTSSLPTYSLFDLNKSP